MTFLTFIDRVIIPAVVLILLTGGIGGVVLGGALVLRTAAALQFIRRMNAWISTRKVFDPLEARHNIDPVPGPGGRRPLLATCVAVGGALAVYFLLTRLDFARSYVPGVNVTRWFFSGLALEATKWILVTGSAFACLVGVLMLFAPARLAAFETRMNTWYASPHLLAADEKMHLPLEPRVEAHPRAAGWTIATASLCVTLAMAGLLIARLH
jgi:ABC-type antimicrobial peptide transport system permease subunit